MSDSTVPTLLAQIREKSQLNHINSRLQKKAMTRHVILFDLKQHPMHPLPKKLSHNPGGSSILMHVNEGKTTIMVYFSHIAIGGYPKD